jgi:uncharacterized membrane protein
MGNQYQIASAVYPNEEQAQTILDTLDKMHRATTITLKDAALVSRTGDGKIHVKETREVTAGKGAKRGAIVAGIFGIIYPPSLIVSVLAGGALGGAWGKLRDTGIKNSSLKGVGDDLAPGQFAVVALAEQEWIPQIENTLQGFEAHPILTPLSADESSSLEEGVASGESSA